MINSGESPRGNICEAINWHGYICMEREAVDLIGNWIKNPTN